MIAVFRFSIFYLKNVNEINDKLFDMKLITVNDYCIGMHIPREFYQKWERENLNNQDESKSPAQEFEMYMTGKVEEIMKRVMNF